MASSLEILALVTVRCFCIVQKQKGVADAMIEARECMPEGMTGCFFGNARFLAILHNEFANSPLGNRLTLVIEKHPGCDAFRSYREIAFKRVDAFFLQ